MSELLTVQEMADRLRVPVSWIYARTRLKTDNTIPFVRVGKYLRFQLNDVMKWLEGQQHDNF